ncbi:MAG TPA: hypothetical protein VMB03_21885 [Bryobacteraceae bacterium]|nr:hypothetical protein [Bryobacteraceae bacterium]
MSPADRIQRFLARNPGLKAQRIADAAVTATFHGLRAGEIRQDNSYSALPLRNRARRAMIIGDPLQRQDRVLLAAQSLAEGLGLLSELAFRSGATPVPDGENYHRIRDGELRRRDQLGSRRLADLGLDIIRFWAYEIRGHGSVPLGRIVGIGNGAGAIGRMKAQVENA